MDNHHQRGSAGKRDGADRTLTSNLLHVVVLGCLCALTQAHANTIVLSGRTFSVNNSESGNYFWSPGSLGDCQGSLRIRRTGCFLWSGGHPELTVQGRGNAETRTENNL
jgi:hypothetical protein